MGRVVRGRLGKALSGRMIAVCDREAHISEYLLRQQAMGGRYVVRVAGERHQCESEQGLWETPHSAELKR